MVVNVSKFILKKIFFYVFLLGALTGITSCHTSKSIKSEKFEPHNQETVQLPASHDTGKIIKEANTWIGTPYKYAHQEKGSGTDCSGFVMKVYETAVGEKLPRNSAKQAEYCDRIGEDDIFEGDLVFFATGKDPNKVSHVGIIINRESFIHASSSKGVVVSSLNNNYYKRTFRMFGRVPRRKK